MNLLTSLYRTAPLRCLFLVLIGTLANRDLGGGHSQVGSLAGAVYLLDNNKGVLREAQREQKSLVEQKGKSFFDFDFQYEYKL